MATHVTTGCRDCKKCTNSGYANLGRNSGRVGVGIMTAGISELVMGGTKNCRICGHKLSLHGTDVGKVKKSPPADWYPEVSSGRLRWWDGDRWGVYKDDWVSEQAKDAAHGDESHGVTEQLADLARLHDAGALTAEEFAAAKAKILGL